jgi:hypothetical protein
MPSATEAAGTAVTRLHAARERARLRREAASKAVEQLRERNREESARLAERGKPGRRAQPQWPGHHHDPRELHLYDEDDPQPPPTRLRPPAAPQPPDDDWSQQTWLH